MQPAPTEFTEEQTTSSKSHGAAGARLIFVTTQHGKQGWPAAAIRTWPHEQVHQLYTPVLFDHLITPPHTLEYQWWLTR
jgi:hypothetical protein